ncbi:MAG: hypothetical protein ACAI34_06560 [Verrucomicrobium sp.]|nr:hypothetical protein [Verrucomicrobium sp.]
MSDVRLLAPVTIREVLTHRTYRATLPNGKEILAYAQGLDGIPPLQTGDAYHVLLSLCDFDEGRLIPENLQGVQVSHPVVRAVA